MDIYYEQSVAGVRSRKNTALYVLCWVVIVLLLLVGVFFAANVFGNDPDHLQINWLSVVFLAVFLAAAGFLFVRKDALRMDYDYILFNDKLEIFGILNSRRRRRLAVISIPSIKGGGAAKSAHCASLRHQRDVKAHNWCGANSRKYLYYMEENTRHLALLELDGHMSDLIRRQLSMGVWRDEEREV